MCPGQRHHKQMICPDAVFAMDIESASDDLRILQFTGISIDEGEFRFRGSFHALCEFSEFLHRIALIDIIKSFGWLFVADAQAVIDRSVSSWGAHEETVCVGHHTGMNLRTALLFTCS